MDGLLAYDRACREGDRAAVEFLGLLDAHDAGRRELDAAAAAAECPVAGLEDYPEWREMSGRLSANGKVLLAALGERAGEAGGTISRRLGELADLLAVDDAVLDFDARRREVAARPRRTARFRSTPRAIAISSSGPRTSPRGPPSRHGRWQRPGRSLPMQRHAKNGGRKSSRFMTWRPGFWTSAAKLEDRARTAGGSEFTPPTELAGYADWLARCGEVRERWRAIRRAMHEDPDTWQPHLDRLKDEAGKIAAAVERFDQLGDHDLAWAELFQKRLTMVERQKAESVIAFYLPGWEELVEEAGALGQREGLPDQARNMVERVLDYDRRLGRERATVDGFLEDAEEHRQRMGPPGG